MTPLTRSVEATSSCTVWGDRAQLSLIVIVPLRVKEHCDQWPNGIPFASTPAVPWRALSLVLDVQQLGVQPEQLPGVSSLCPFLVSLR